MSTIHMQVESVQETAQQLQADGSTLSASLDTIRRAIQSLTSAWEGGDKDEYISQADDTIRLLNQQADDLGILLQHLAREIQEWQETDQRGASQFTNLSSTGVDQMLSVGSGSALPLSAGGWSDGAGVFSISLLPLSAAISVSSLLQGMPDWLRHFLDQFFPQTDVVSPLPSDVFPKRPAPVKPSVTFGDLIKKTEGSTSTYEEYYNVPTLSQGNLYGSAACAPTSVSMVTDYYHNQDSSHAAVTPDKLITMLDPGDGTPGKGANLGKMTDEVQSLGYKVPLAQGGATMDNLTTQLKDGPIIITAGVGIVGPGTITSNVPRAITGPGGTIHAMVVKGMTKDEKSIIVNDPWTGGELSFSTDTFKSMWQKGGNGIFVIRP